MKIIRVAALCGLVSAPAGAFAADLFSTAPADDNQFFEITNSWYLRGDVGASFDTAPNVSFDPSVFGAPPGPTITPGVTGSSTQADYEFDVGVGYRFNDYFRMDTTFDYRSGIRFNNVTPGIVCPYNANPVYNQDILPSGTVVEVPVGYQYDTNDTCNGNFALKQQNYTTLLNGYVDLFTMAGFTPYIGAGLGFNIQSTSGSLTFTESGNGSPYRADLTPPAGGSSSAGLNPTNIWVFPNGTQVNPQPKISFAPQNWDRTYKKTQTSFAFDLTAGVGYQLTHEATLDLSYRFLDYGKSTIGINPNTGATVNQNNYAQEVRIGIRYTPE
jgi:opacity protein-like surface antigen